MNDISVQMILALAAIDEALGIPADGCNSTARTLNAIRELQRRCVCADAGAAPVPEGRRTLRRGKVGGILRGRD